MSNKMLFSLIIPVYNRPQEVDELLESLTRQTEKNFEVIIVEDGSTEKSETIAANYSDQLTLHYYFKSNSGPGQSRNYGYERASGDYYIFLDSDCILPPTYMEAVNKAIASNYVDAFGGPDRALDSFTTIQKAINYSMTSFLTTGGIRGSGEKMEKFHPRSFNMGVSKLTMEKTKGFSKMRFGEDIDLSIRINRENLSTGLYKDAYVYHKRRSTLRQFFKQIFNSGIARINLSKRHPGSLKLVHALPAAFLLGTLMLIVLSLIVSPLFAAPLGLLTFLFFIDSLLKNKSVKIACMSVITSYIQLFAYGSGFIISFWYRNILKRDEFHAFRKNFYK